MFRFLFNKKSQVEAKLPYSTELHCHIIPAVDDGSASLEDSLELCTRLKALGVNKILATPHCTESTFENTVETIEPQFNSLVEGLASSGVDIELHFSFEYRIDDNFLNIFKNKLIKPLPGNYVLVENSFIQPSWNLENLLYELKLQGYIPILAHPERYLYYASDKSIYTKLYDQGTLFQINLLSFAGFYGKNVQRTALWMLEKGYVDFIGTDCHNMTQIVAIEDYLKSKAYQKIKDQFKLLNDTL